MRADYKRKRDRYGIIADILATCRESTSTVQLLRRANTCHVQLKLIAPELVSRGLLEREGTSYRTTKQGFEWLRLYRQLQNSRSGQNPPRRGGSTSRGISARRSKPCAGCAGRGSKIVIEVKGDGRADRRAGAEGRPPHGEEVRVADIPTSASYSRVKEELENAMGLDKLMFTKKQKAAIKRGIQKLVKNKVAETLVKFNDELESSGAGP